MLLARLGLRPCEVVALTLDDIDWHHGELLVRGKGNRHERLPLPDEVGAAVASYLQEGRPRATDGGRAVFLRARAPWSALGFPGVQTVVRDASRVPAWRSLGPAICAAMPPPRCTEAARLSAPSPRCSVITIRGSPRSMSMSMTVSSAGSPEYGRGREMNELRRQLFDYVALRRSLGYVMKEGDFLLPSFVAYLEDRNARHITTELALAWAISPSGVLPITRQQRLGVVRGFAKYSLRTLIDKMLSMPRQGEPPQL